MMNPMVASPSSTRAPRTTSTRVSTSDEPMVNWPHTKNRDLRTVGPAPPQPAPAPRRVSHTPVTDPRHAPPRHPPAPGRGMLTANTSHDAPKGENMPTVVVTGGSGKLGSACVAHLAESGWEVVVFDRVGPTQGVRTYVPVDLTDYGQVLDAMLGVEERYARVDALVHLAAVPAPGIGAGPQHLRQQHERHLERRQRGPAGRGHQHRLGVQRDGAGSALRHPAAVRAGRRGVSAAAGVDVLAGQDHGGDHGRAAVPLGSRS